MPLGKSQMPVWLPSENILRMQVCDSLAHVQWALRVACRC